MKISQEARQAAARYFASRLGGSVAEQLEVLRDDLDVVQHMQSLINSTLERAALELEQFGELDGSFSADVIRQLIEE